MVYEQKLLVLYSCLLYSIVFASLFLPFTIEFFIAFNQNNSWNRQTANANKLTKAKERNLLITAHCTLTSVWPSCFLWGQVCCTDYRQQNGVHARVSLGLNFRTRLHSTLRKKEEKRKFWGRLVDRLRAVTLQSVQSKLGRIGESEMPRGSFPSASCFLLSLTSLRFLARVTILRDCSQSNLWKV